MGLIIKPIGLYDSYDGIFFKNRHFPETFLKLPMLFTHQQYKQQQMKSNETFKSRLIGSSGKPSKELCLSTYCQS